MSLSSRELSLSSPECVIIFTWICHFLKIWCYPSRLFLVQNQIWQHQNKVWNLFKVNNKGTRTMALWLTLNRFHTLFCCFHCWLWISNYQLGLVISFVWRSATLFKTRLQRRYFLVKFAKIIKSLNYKICEWLLLYVCVSNLELFKTI